MPLLALPALLLALALLMLAQAGYTGEDDAHYLFAADAWRSGQWFLGVNHWHLRHPHVLAIAASFTLFGRNEGAMILPTVVAFLGVITLTVWLVRRVADDWTAVFAGLLVAATPAFVLYAKIPYPDVGELFYGVLSFALLWKGLETSRYRWFVLSGLAMAFAWLIRPSCAPFILLYGLLFLIGYRVPRSRYLAMGIGFAPPILAEWLYYYLRAGDPFYRFAVDMHSLEIPTAHMMGGVAHGLRPPFNAELMAKWVPNSMVDVHWLVNPYIDFLTSPSFGLLYSAAIIAAFLLLRDRRLQPEIRQFAWIMIALALLWIFVTIYVLNLRPQPRYFLPATWCACILAAMGLRHVLREKGRLPAFALLAILIVSDAALVSARKDPMEAERQLAAFAASRDGPMTSDLGKARFFLEQRGMAGRVTIIGEGLRPPAGLFLTSSDQVESWSEKGVSGFRPVSARPSWLDRFWAVVVPQKVYGKLRPRRDLMLAEVPDVSSAPRSSPTG
ncbi:glycosyltransferase family 39 protein [Sphingobium sp. CFD-1]|uniref:ArnT family glycosyltransferase n=1 Tax=Sphingobium sp. CFD-1 TaxID=2878545 RepID=UPI00214CCB6A|nr:glycosyltransferase family 39 protein [Sphingobium sp. CFD-1]